jgi:NADPH:quinone reductase-like Zn-dependent oxidoreductase
MRAFVLPAFDEAPALRDDLPTPEPGNGELLVRVRASSVNPVDAAIVGGMLKAMFAHDFPVVLGRDFAGAVEQIGSAVTRYAVGDEVFGYLPLVDPNVHDGSWAELIVVPEDDFVARAPSGLDVSAVGAAPLAGITAMLALDALQLAAGSALLIVGATGGVGTFAVQLATRVGVTVIAPALAEDEAYLRGLGAAELVERGGDVVAAVRDLHPDGVDALLDLVSYTPDALDAYAAALLPGGRAASSNGAAGDGAGRANLMATSSPQNLERLAALLGGGLEVPIQRSYPLEEAGAALADLGASHTLGKLAIAVS